MYIRVIGEDIKNFKNREVILFGCGSCGLRVLEEFEKVGATIVAFCDNNNDLIGKKINNYNIMGPIDLWKYPKSSIIIASTYEKEIEKQLKDMKINNYFHVKVGVLKESIPKDNFSNLVLSVIDSNNYLYEKLNEEGSFFIGRLGSVELECLSHYLFFVDRTSNEVYPQNLKNMMNINAGFFPIDDDRLIDDFCGLYMQGLRDMDIIWSMWFSKYEDMIYRVYCKEKLIMDYDNSILPIHFVKPWTLALKGKKVLVIHPFEDSIQNNYKIKDKLFDNKKFIPDFDLITLKAVQSIANNKTIYNNWFEALEDMENKINQIDFDIALIGAGAYGLPLGAYIKNLGKKAIHVGGILQLYFGIKGKAWDKLNIYNEFWTSPQLHERPNEYKSVEAGRYW